jgi:hypothetical protein
LFLAGADFAKGSRVVMGGGSVDIKFTDLCYAKSPASRDTASTV